VNAAMRKEYGHGRFESSFGASRSPRTV
jgi:hypothetical protein